LGVTERLSAVVILGINCIFKHAARCIKPMSMGWQAAAACIVQATLVKHAAPHSLLPCQQVVMTHKFK
jgi:hypothetical protein